MTPMQRWLAACLASAIVLACAAPPPPGTAAVATTPPAATAAAATPSPSPTPRPSPLTSGKGTITVREPASGETISGGVTVSGDASVFEANVQWKVVTATGKVLAQGHTTASAGAPRRGTFRVDVRFEPPYYGEAGFVEVFEVSPKDGTISDIVRVPVTIQGSY
jgi:hypothetical protein